jgi:hypothetical protein
MSIATDARVTRLEELCAHLEAALLKLQARLKELEDAAEKKSGKAR